jgi:GNAT superfamily N-acetyltransferase
VLHYVEVPVSDDRAHALLDQYFAEREAGFPPDQGAYTRRFPTAADFTRPAGVFLLGLNDADRAVAIGGIRRLSAERYEVKHLWVSPDLRGSGAGRATLMTLERIARECGATEVVLDTNSSLIAARRLYESSGYVPIDAYNDNPNATDWFSRTLTDR